MTTSSTSSTRSATPDLRRHAFAIGGALVATVLLWTVAHLLGVRLRVDPGHGQPLQVVGLPVVAASTLVVSLLGSATRKVLDRLTDRAPAVWPVVAVTVLVLSLAPVAYVQASGGAKVTLGLMHVAVAAVLVPLLRRGNAD